MTFETGSLSSVIGNLLYSSAFCPYHVGHFSVVGLGLEDYVSAELRIILEALCLSYSHCVVSVCR